MVQFRFLRNSICLRITIVIKKNRIFGLKICGIRIKICNFRNILQIIFEDLRNSDTAESLTAEQGLDNFLYYKHKKLVLKFWLAHN